jgi:uncharacterized protein (TIGR02444 family)
MNDQSHPFWQFSLNRYQRNAVAPLCLQVQDEFKADVNLVLFGLWLGSMGYKLTGKGAKRSMVRVADWHRSVVIPMRGVRRWLKYFPVDDPEARDSLRANIQRQEIESERMEQNMLYHLWAAESGTMSENAEAGAETMAGNAARFCTPGAGEVLGNLARLCL